MSVFIDGSTLSSLLYSHSNSPGNEEGLLLGQVVSHVKDHISDSQINTSHVQTYMCVSSHMPWPSEDKMYSRGGVPIMEKMAALLGENHVKEEVVGWYSFRRNASLRMSMKERTLHKHLEQRFSPHKPDHFLFFMCVETTSTECSTHSLDHFFVTVAQGSGGVKKISMTITNLGDTLHTSYKTLANAGVTQSSNVRNILHQLRPQFVSSSGEMAEVKRIDDLSSTLNNNLMRLYKQVAESEQSTGELEQEVEQMKEELAQKEEEHMLAQKLQAGVEKGVDSNPFPVQKSALSGEPASNQAPGEERLVVDLGLGSDKPAGSEQGPASIDDLLTGCATSDLSETAQSGCLYPVLPPNPEQHQPAVSAPNTSGLQSVVDTITDTDEEEIVGTGSQSKSASDVPPHIGAGGTIGGPVNLNNSDKKGFHVSTGQSHTDTKNHTTGPSEGGKSNDHFSFVDNLLTSGTSGTGPSHKKTAMVPTGATLTYSPRTTRSQASRGNTDRDKTATKEKSNPRNNQSERSETNSKSKEAVSLPTNPAQKSQETELSSSSLKGNKVPSNQSVNAPIKSETHIGSQDKSNSSSPKQGSSSSSSNTRVKLDPANFDLAGRQKSRSQVTSGTSKKSATNSVDCEKTDCVSQENVNASRIQDVGKNVCRSSSPVF